MGLYNCTCADHSDLPLNRTSWIPVVVVARIHKGHTLLQLYMSTFLSFFFFLLYIMECLETKQLLHKTFATEHTTTTAITGCHYHHISFAISKRGQLLAADAALEHLELGRLDPSDGVEQAVSCCSNDSAECIYYLRTSANTVYQLTIDPR